VRQRGDIKRQTSRAVYLWDRAAGAVISVGGAAVLAAVLGICVYLVWEVLPLFNGGDARPQPVQSAVAPRAAEAAPVLAILGDYSQAVLLLDQSGSMRAVSLGTGKEFWRSDTGKAVTAVSRPEHEGLTALALSDGSLQIGRIALPASLLIDDEVPKEARALPVGGEQIVGEGAAGRLIQRTRTDQCRETAPSVKLHEALPPGGTPVVRIDLRESPDRARFMVTLRSDGAAAFGTVRTVTPLGGGEPKDKVTSTPFTIAQEARGQPDWLFVTSDGHHVLAVWSDGTLQRYSTGVGTEGGIAIALAESINIAPGTQVTCAAMLLGGQTLIAGELSGDVVAYEAGRDATSAAPDGMRLVRSGEFRVENRAARALAIGERDRIVAAADEVGAITVRHMTSRKTIAHMHPTSAASAPQIMALTPKGNALLSLDDQGHYQAWSLSLGHADASTASLFAPLVYEGEVSPQFIYQSSSGGDAAEVKLSLVPLIFGTLKATVVGMLVAVPLAVLGAIYSSEFMHKRVRKIVKPTVEMMASLPSVVLGFVAAIVVAPYMRDWLPRVLVGILLTPVFLVFFAYLWQMVPRDAAAKVTRRARVLLVGAALAASMALGAGLGDRVERALFRPTHTDILVAGGSYEPAPKDQWPAWVGQRQIMSPDEERLLRQQGLYFRGGQVVHPMEADVSPTAAGPPGVQRWLDGSIGDAMPGWLAGLFLPVLLGLSFVQSRLINRERFEQMLGTSRMAMAAAELARFTLVVLAGAVLTYALAWIFTRLGWDTRDSIFGPYSQRNSLVVGVIMGFAVIPLVYTISEDALRSVPNSLRSASLGVGATPWQTAVRVVLPAAGSGVFSAIMIGLGRAVGETMIVLMATGNTPEISSNIFSGFRTLAANIATELPEAESGSTHMRVLFLCGLILFAMTFLVNTTAEVVRQRFRKRNAAL
jgi:phosphate transport system permease protein